MINTHILPLLNSVCSTLYQSIKHPIILSLASTAVERLDRLISLFIVSSCRVSSCVELGVQSEELFSSLSVVTTSNEYKCWIGHCIIIVRPFLDCTHIRTHLVCPSVPSMVLMILPNLLHSDHFSFLNSSIHTSNELFLAVKLSQFNQILPPPLSPESLRNLSNLLHSMCEWTSWFSVVGINIPLKGLVRTELYNQLRGGRESVVLLGHHLKCMTVVLS